MGLVPLSCQVPHRNGKENLEIEHRSNKPVGTILFFKLVYFLPQKKTDDSLEPPEMHSGMGHLGKAKAKTNVQALLCKQQYICGSSCLLMKKNLPQCTHVCAFDICIETMTISACQNTFSLSANEPTSSDNYRFVI